MPVIDGASFSLGLALAFPVYFFVDHFLIPWLVDTFGRRRHGRV